MGIEIFSPHLVRRLFVPVLGPGLWVGLHAEVPPIELHHNPVLHMGQDLSDGLICVTLTDEDTVLLNQALFY